MGGDKGHPRPAADDDRLLGASEDGTPAAVGSLAADSAAGSSSSPGDQEAGLGSPPRDLSAGLGSPPDESAAGVADGSSRTIEPRVRGAWQAWLSSLATDANAATAAAHLYAELPDDARDAWLAALAEDAPDLNVPEAAIYGPLLAVEADPLRLDRISRAAHTTLGPITEVKRALLGTGAGGSRLAVLVIPLYLDFVRVLMCRMVKDRGFEWVRQEPITRDADAPDKGTVVDGIKLYPSSRDAVVDELAHAVLAHRRQGRDLPQLLVDCADLFSAALVSEVR